MINLVQSEHRGEFFVDECFDDCFYRLIRPFFQWLLQTEFVQNTRDGLWRAAVTGELAL